MMKVVLIVPGVTVYYKPVCVERCYSTLVLKSVFDVARSECLTSVWHVVEVSRNVMLCDWASTSDCLERSRSCNFRVKPSNKKRLPDPEDERTVTLGNVWNC